MSDWIETTLGEVSKEVSYGYTESASNEKIGPKFLRITDIQGGVVNWNDVPYCPINEKDLAKYKLSTGDIVVARTGNSTGENYLFSSDEEAVYASYLIKFSIKNTVNPKFVWYSMRSPKWWGFIKGNKTGSAQAGANAKTLSNFQLNLPPLPEQKAIANILGTLDDKIELNRKMNQTLEAMAQALFKSWFVDFDPVLDNALAAGKEIPDALKAKAAKRLNSPSGLEGVPAGRGSSLLHTNRTLAKLFPSSFTYNETLEKWVPEGWEVKSFGDVSECFDRKRIPLSKKQREEKQPGPYPYYGATSINDYINDYIFDDTYLLLGEDGSVMHEDGTPFTQYVWGKIWVNNHAHVLQGTNGISTEHLMTFIRSENINAYVTGAVQLKINQKNMNSIPFLKASNDVNEQFAKTLDKLYGKFKLNFEETETLIQLRDTLLPQLISGKVRVPEEMMKNN